MTDIYQSFKVPDGYTLLRPTELDVWREGDLWLTWLSTWEPVVNWIGIPIQGIGARPKETK